MESHSSTIVARLIELGESINPNELVFADDPHVGDLLHEDPFAFILATSLDRGGRSKIIWRIPGKIRAALGHLNPRNLAEMREQEVLALLRSLDGKPRYMNDAPRTIIEVAKMVTCQFGGDARNVWRRKRVREIRRSLEQVHGVGPGISAMFVNLLWRLGEIDLLPGDYESMDVKPDVHVMRVFCRCGLCLPDASENDVLQAARDLVPDNASRLDAPAWHVGHYWCHPQEPDCCACPVSETCPKLI